MTEAQYKRHIEIFPEGQMVVLDGDQVIASTTLCFKITTKGHHTFLEISIIYGWNSRSKSRMALWT